MINIVLKYGFANLKIEDLNDIVSIKIIEYLENKANQKVPMKKSPHDRMMMYEEQRAAEKQLEDIYRQANYLLDIINKKEIIL